MNELSQPHKKRGRFTVPPNDSVPSATPTPQDAQARLPNIPTNATQAASVVNSRSWVTHLSQLHQIQLVGIFASGITMVIPGISDPFEQPKLLTMLTLFVMWLTSKSITSLINKQLQLFISPVSIGLLTFSLISAGTSLASDNPIEALIHPLGPIMFGSLALICLTTRFSSRLLQIILIGSGLIMAAQGYVFYLTYPPLVSTIHTSLGHPIVALIVMITALFLLIHWLFRLKPAKITLIVFIGLCLALSGSILIQTLFVYAKVLPLLPPWTASWHVALTVLTIPNLTLFGFGTQHHLSAFALYRPESILSTPHWNSYLAYGNNLFFHLATTTGIGSILIFAGTTIGVLLQLKKQSILPLLLTMFVVLLIPASISTIIIVVVLVLLNTYKYKEIHINIHKYSLLLFSQYLCIGILFIALSVLLAPLLIAEYNFVRAQYHLRLQQPQQAYERVTISTRWLPFITRYRQLSTETQLLLASQLNNSEDAIQLQADLISQAVADAKAATILSPKNLLAWETQSLIYAELLAVAQNASQFYVHAVIEAKNRDPINPLAYYRLATAYRLNNAITEAQTAINTALTYKQDIPELYIEQALIYEVQQNQPAALAAYKSALSLLPPLSSRYTQVQNRIQTMESDSN